MRMLSDYVLAASHLYGVVSLHDFELLLRYYEKNLDDFDGYAREEGSYKNTILFQPRYLGLCTLQQLIGNTVPEVLTTMDGLFLHPSFTEDFQKEQKEMVKAFAKNGGQNVGEKDFDQFFAAAGEKTSYRKLLRDTMDKPMYLPTKEEFLKYVNEDYHVISTAEKNLRNYLKGKYGKELETAAQAAGDYSEDMYVATGEKDTVAEQKLADYAMEGVQFSCLRVGNIETHSVQKGTETSVELIYEIPEKLADILKLMKENAVDMSKQGEAYPCHNTGVLHYTGQQISDALEAILKADEVAAKNALEHYLYDYGTLDATTDQKEASGVCNLPKTDKNGYTHLDNLELGLYLFVETEVPEQVTDTVNPWFVQLPFTSADGDMWQYDMNVYPKNQSGNPTLDKSVRNAYSNTLSVNEQVPSGTDKNTSVHAGEAYVAGNDSEALIVYNREAQSADLTDAAYVANRGGYTADGVTAGKDGSGYSTDYMYRDTTTASEGDLLDYILVSKLPHITSEATFLSEYTFQDTLSGGITYNKDVKIAFYDNAMDANANNTKNAKVLWNLNSGDYTQHYVDVTVTNPDTGVQNADGSTRLTVALTEDGLRAVNGVDAAGKQIESLSDYYMVVYYTATVKSDASVVLGDEGNPNHVNLVWSRTSDGYYNMLEDQNYVYTYGLDLTKTFSDQKGKFEHVKFKLYNSTDGYYVMAEKSTTEDGVYYVVGKTVNEEQATEFIPNADSGKLLVNGAEADSYQLTEIATDKGYHLLKDQIKIDISATDRDIIASVAGVTGMDAAAVEAVVNHYQGGIYDENGNLVTAQRDELTGAMAGGPALESANGRTIGKTDLYVGTIQNAFAKIDDKDALMTDQNQAVLLTVNNTKEFLLPQTGGKGLYLITIVGVISVAGGCYLVTRKREKAKM